MTFSEPGRKLSISVNSFGEIILTLWSFLKKCNKARQLPSASASGLLCGIKMIFLFVDRILLILSRIFLSMSGLI